MLSIKSLSLLKFHENGMYLSHYVLRTFLASTHLHSLHVFSDPYYSSTTLDIFDRATPPVKILFDFVHSLGWNWN